MAAGENWSASRTAAVLPAEEDELPLTPDAIDPVLGAGPATLDGNDLPLVPGVTAATGVAALWLVVGLEAAADAAPSDPATVAMAVEVAVVVIDSFADLTVDLGATESAAAEVACALDLLVDFGGGI